MFLITYFKYLCNLFCLSGLNNYRRQKTQVFGLIMPIMLQAFIIGKYIFLTDNLVQRFYNCRSNAVKFHSSKIRNEKAALEEGFANVTNNQCLIRCIKEALYFYRASQYSILNPLYYFPTLIYSSLLP